MGKGGLVDVDRAEDIAAVVDMGRDAGAQVHEVIIGVMGRRGEVGSGAVAGHDDLGFMGGHGFEALDPFARRGELHHAKNAFDIDDIAGEHDLAIGEPDIAVARCMRAAGMADFKGALAEGQGMAFGECRVGKGGVGAGQFIPEQGREHGLLHRGAGLLIRDRVLGSDDGGAEVFPIAVGDPAMILSAGVDDVFDRRVSHRFDRLMQSSGPLVASASVDEDGAFGRDDKAESGVVSKVFRVALFMRADNGESAGGDFGHRKGRGVGGQGESQEGGESKQDAGHGGLRNVARP